MTQESRRPPSPVRVWERMNAREQYDVALALSDKATSRKTGLPRLSVEQVLAHLALMGADIDGALKVMRYEQGLVNSET